MYKFIYLLIFTPYELVGKIVGICPLEKNGTGREGKNTILKKKPAAAAIAAACSIRSYSLVSRTVPMATDDGGAVVSSAAEVTTLRGTLSFRSRRRQDGQDAQDPRSSGIFERSPHRVPSHLTPHHNPPPARRQQIFGGTLLQHRVATLR